MKPSPLASELFERLYAEAYNEGRMDEKKELLSLLSPGKTSEARKPQKPASKPRAKSRRRRAPKGIVPTFVSRVLGEAGPLTPAEVMGRARSADERMIKEVSVRNQLRKGEKSGAYKKAGGKWSLSGKK